MTTSNYQCNVTVEIAFNAGFNTPAASRTWTDVSDYLELEDLITITCGRQDQRSTADANTLTLTLDNRDGRFTPFRTTGAYYPNVKLDRPIRVTSDPVDGAASVRFLGFINEWPVAWEGMDGYSKVTITASSRLARLGTVAALKSIVETAILADSPAAYYTLGEAAGSTQANDSSGNRADPLTLTGDATLPVVFGNATGPGTDSLTAAQFAGGQYLRTQGIGVGAATSLTVEFFLTRSGVPASREGVLSWANAGGTPFSLTINNSTGRPEVWEAFSIDTTGPTAVTDGSVHHIAIVYAAVGFTVYLDGASSFSGGLGHTMSLNDLSVGAAPAVTALSLNGSMSHLAITLGSLSAAQIASHANAGLNGYAGETTSVRLARYAGYAGVESAAVNAETGQVTVQHVDTTDKQAVELMRIMETTEGGFLHDNRDGLTTFHNRAHRLALASSYTLDMAQQMVEADYLPKLDRIGIANDVTATDVSGAYTAHVFDATSKTDNGVATMSIETASQDDDEPLFQASWALYRNKDPKVRVPSLTVDALSQVGKTPSCFTVMATNMGDKITLSNRPTQDSTSSASFYVEGYTEVYGRESLRITFNVSPSAPEDTTYICGDATRGVIGTNPIAL